MLDDVHRQRGLTHRWARGKDLSPSPKPGDGTVTPAVAEAWRAVLFRKPRWHLEEELRAEFGDEDVERAIHAHEYRPGQRACQAAAAVASVAVVVNAVVRR